MTQQVESPNNAPTEMPETKLRERWPSVASVPGIATLGRALNNSIFLAPLGWLLMSLVFFGKFTPFLAKRYTITNRRVMIARGLSRQPGQSVALQDIDGVKVVYDGNSDFFRAGTIEIVANGQTALTMAGCPEPENFKRTIESACAAFVVGRKPGPFVAASSKTAS